jgi:hypothetical protein
LKNRVTTADSNFVWTTENGFRKLKIPMLGWEICYQVQDNKLFVSNNFEFLQAIVFNQNESIKNTSNFNNLTVIRLQNHEANFEQIMQQFTTEKDDFFTGNVSSLLGVISDVKEIEIRRNSDELFLNEEILLNY